MLGCYDLGWAAAIACTGVIWSCAALPRSELVIDCAPALMSGEFGTFLTKRLAGLDPLVDTVVLVWSGAAVDAHVAVPSEYETGLVFGTSRRAGLYAFSDRWLGLSGRSVRLYRSAHVVLVCPPSVECLEECATSAMRAAGVAFVWELSGAQLYLVVPLTYRGRARAVIEADPVLKPYLVPLPESRPLGSQRTPSETPVFIGGSRRIR